LAFQHHRAIPQQLNFRLGSGLLDHIPQQIGQRRSFHERSDDSFTHFFPTEVQQAGIGIRAPIAPENAPVE
jgi:hypothetical protein